MYGREGGMTSFYQALLDRGVPRFAAGKALRAKIIRDARRRRVPQVPPGQSPRHKPEGYTHWCGSCYERSKGR